jgi:nucleotide-binding universal stress UspA family protein
VIFRRALVGNDGSAAALSAIRLTRQLLVPDGELVALAVAEVHFATHAGMDAAAWVETLRESAAAATADAERELQGVPGATARVAQGYAAPTLISAAADMDADLIVVGSRGRSRAVGFALGSVATRVIHDAPCSVLVAREDTVADGFPRSVVVGVDGSPQSREAQAIADAIAAAAGVRARHLAATGGKSVPEAQISDAELDSRSAVEALVEAGRTADLVVVGSRGLHGVAALGSVAERVAHRANSAVLIVRAPPSVSGPGP